MKNPKVNYALVGSFVLAMLAAFIVSLAILAGRASSTNPYYAHYNNVTGVLPGTLLLFEGFRIGQVERIDQAPPSSEKRYRVEFSVEEGWPIPEDSVAWITEPTLLSAITVDIHAGESETLLPPGSEIHGHDLQSVFTAMTGLAGEAEEMLVTNVKPLIDSLSESTPEIIQNVEALTDDLARVTEQVAILFNEENTEQLDDMIGSLNRTSQNLEDLSASLDSSLGQVDEIVVRVNRLLDENTDDVESALADIQYSLETVARHIGSVNAHLEGTTRNMYEFSRQLRRDPSVLVRGNRGAAEPVSAGVEP